MTRINAGIDVRCLTDEHLLAEHREIKRLPYCLDAAIKSGSINHIPEKFTLGKGHVLFFFDKMHFTLLRYHQIYNELKARGFNIHYYGNNWWNTVSGKEYKPTDECKQLLIERITQRIMNSPKKCFHYYGKAISKEEAVELLKQ